MPQKRPAKKAEERDEYANTGTRASDRKRTHPNRDTLGQHFADLSDGRQTPAASPYVSQFAKRSGARAARSQHSRPPLSLSKAIAQASKQAIDTIYTQAPRGERHPLQQNELLPPGPSHRKNDHMEAQAFQHQQPLFAVPLPCDACPTRDSLDAMVASIVTLQGPPSHVSTANSPSPTKGPPPGPASKSHAVTAPTSVLPEAPALSMDAVSSAFAAPEAGAAAESSPHRIAAPEMSPRNAKSERSPRARGSGVPFDVYEALKRQQPTNVQQQIELEEAFWDARELQDRRKELQQQLRDDEMLARIKRRIAGEKINLPSVNVPEFVAKLLTPRGTSSNPGTARSAYSSQPISARSEGGRPNLLAPSEQSLGADPSVGLVGKRPSAAVRDAPSVRTSVTGRNSVGGRDVDSASKVVRGSHAARDSWLAYYQGEVAQPPSWRMKLQERVSTLVNHPDFGLAVTLLIALNCLALALYEPQLPDDSGRNPALNKLEMAINFAFTAEVILTCIAAGGPKEYLRSPWNIFDLSMVLVGYTDFIPSGGEQAGGVRALRALRALRPLRTITRFESLRSIVVCFLEALPLLLTVMQLLVFFIVLAAITGTLLFMNSFRFACFNNISGLQETNGGLKDYGCGDRVCPSNYTCQEYSPSKPLTAAGFGNVGESILSVFQVITLNGWAYIMYIVMDNTGPASFIFFIVIVLLQAYFVINLFLAVLKNKFAKAQELYSKASVQEDKPRSTFALLWLKLQEWLKVHSARRREKDDVRMMERSSKGLSGFSTPTNIQESAHEMQKRRPSLQIPKTRLQWAKYYAGSYWFEFRWHLRQVVEHPMFDYFFIACIVANTVLLAMTTAEMSPGYASAIDTGSRVFTVVFAVEATAKIIGLGLWGYMADRFNIFDLVVVVLGIVEMIIAMGSSGTALRSFKTLRIMRSLRVLRVLKVFRYLQSLRVITDVLLSSMGAFLAIAGLMTLFIFVFAIVGLQTFGHYDLTPEFPNFHNVWHAIILVFQTLTLENWAQLMFSVQAVGGWATTIFFVVWVALGKWTLLTLFLAITLSAFEANYEKYNRSSSSGGRAFPVRMYLAVKQFLQGRFGRKRRRVAPTMSFISMLSFNSANSAQSLEQEVIKPKAAPGKRLQRTPTGFVRAPPGGFDLSPSSTIDDEGRDSEGPNGKLKIQAKLQLLASQANATPTDLLLAVRGRNAGGQEGTTRCPEAGQKLAAGLPLSPAELMLAVGSGTDEQEAPGAAAAAQPKPLRHATPSTTPGPSPAVPNVILTIGRGTDDSEAPSEPPQSPASEAKGRLPAPDPRPGTLHSPPTKGLISAFHVPAGVLASRQAMAERFQGLVGQRGRRGGAEGAAGGHGDSRSAVSPSQGRSAARRGGRRGADVGGDAEPCSPSRHPSITLPNGHVGSLVQQFETASNVGQPRVGASGNTGRESPQPDSPTGSPARLASNRGSPVHPPGRQLHRSSSAPLSPLRSALAGSRSTAAAVVAAAAAASGDAGGGNDDDDAASVRSEGDAPNGAAGAEALKQQGARLRRARFAVPDDVEESQPAVAAPFLDSLDKVDAPAAGGKAGGRSLHRSPTPKHLGDGSPVGLAALRRSTSGLSGASATNSDSDSDASFTQAGTVFGRQGRGSRFNRSSESFRQLGRLNSSSTAGSDQFDDTTTLGSELSGTSSVTGRPRRLRKATTFNRLTSGARLRSKRQDFPALVGRSMFFFKADSVFRNKVYDLVTLRYFDYVMMFVVLLSCVGMAMETPTMDPTATRTLVLKWIDVSTTIVFWVEVVLKCIAFSFRAYIGYFTNKVDFGVVVISTIVLIAESVNARFLKAFRVARAIKPLRILTRSVSMLLVFNTLTRSLMEMGNVTVLCALCFLIFAILGVQLFAGLFWSCTDPSVAGEAECSGTFVNADGRVAARQWQNLHFNFDDIGNAFLTLFITATLDGYTPAMYMSMSTRAEPGLQPRIGSNSAAFLYWFAYITLVAFFVLNLYVGVVFYQFQRLKMMSQTGSAVLTASQTGYVEMMKAVFRLKPLDKAPLPPNIVRRVCHQLAYNRWFDNTMTLIIVANILLLATTYYEEPESFASAKEYSNTAFSGLVILECLIKVVAMGPKLYWRSSWNKFDLALCLAAFLDILTQILNSALGSVVDLSTIKKGMMLLRTLRMFKLMRKFKGIQSLMTTLIISLPAIINVGALLVLFFFIYSYMGVMLLGNIKPQINLNSHANFQNFPNAMLVLFRVATGDDWAGIMQDCMVQPPFCNAELGECGSVYVWIYFMSFYLAVGLIAFNLFTTVILETFERIQDTELWRITPANLDEFCELWAEFDDGTSLIDPKHLEQILMRMRPPMGLGCKATGTDVVRFVFALDIPLVDGKVPFYRTAFELVKKGAHAEIPSGELKSKLDRMIRRFLQKHQTEEEENMSFSVACTVVRIQRHWRGLVAKRKEAAADEAARLARRVAGLPSEDEAVQEAEKAAAPEERRRSVLGVVRRASVALASIRDSMKRSRKFTALSTPQMLQSQEAPGSISTRQSGAAPLLSAAEQSGAEPLIEDVGKMQDAVSQFKDSLRQMPLVKHQWK